MCVCVQVCIRCGYVGGGCSLYKYVACINWTHTHIHYSIRWYIQKSWGHVFEKSPLPILIVHLMAQRHFYIPIADIDHSIVKSIMSLRRHKQLVINLATEAVQCAYTTMPLRLLMVTTTLTPVLFGTKINFIMCRCKCMHKWKQYKDTWIKKG